MERWQVGDEFRIRLVDREKFTGDKEITWDYTDGVWGVEDKGKQSKKICRTKGSGTMVLL